MRSGVYAAEVWEYVDSIADGKKVACEDLRLACIRFRNDCDSGKWDYSPEEADYVITKIQTQFIHIKGEDLEGNPLKGKPLILEPWQKFIVYGILCLYIKGTKIRKIKEAFIFIPRKNGKTLFVSALAWGLALLSVKSGATIYLAAASLRQAMQSFVNIRDTLIKSIYESEEDAKSDGWRFIDNNMAHVIENRDVDGGSIYIEALAANPDAHDSLNCNIAIADELHAFTSAKQYTIIRDAMKAYTNKLMIGISTAGKGGSTGFCAQRLKLCHGILATDAHDSYAEQIFIYICRADQDKNGNVDYLDPEQHEKANPNIGISVRKDEMMTGALEALNDPQQRVEYLNKSLNIFVASERAYFDIYEFKNSDEQHNWTIEELAKLPIKWYGGADLSKMYDLTAACLYGTYNDVDIIIPHCWFPIVQAERKAEEDNIPLFGWQDDGWLTMCNGKTVNQMDVVKWFMEMREMGFRIVEIGHDRRYCREYVVAMKKAHFRVVDQPQYGYVKSEGFRHIELRVKENKLYYMHAEPFEYCVQNVQAVEKTDDIMLYSKFDDNLRIDVFDASVFACVRMLNNIERASKAEEWNE